jgi:uncharacterized protein YkwD
VVTVRHTFVTMGDALLLDLARRAPTRLAVLLVAVVAVASACLPFNSQEEYLYNATNQLRYDHNVPAIPGHDHLTTRAREWAHALAAQGRLAHSDMSQLGISWTAVAENVGRSHSIEDIYQRLSQSAPHRANMLDGRYTHTGVGTARAKDGTIYAVQIFWRG